jgi:hypothetical protein
LWDIKLCSLEEIYQHFRSAEVTNISEVPTASVIRAMIALIMEAVSTSETSVNFYQSHGATSLKTFTYILFVMRI